MKTKTPRTPNTPPEPRDPSRPPWPGPEPASKAPDGPGLAALAGVHHVAIKLRDLEAAERFYCGVLGLEVVRRWRYPGEPPAPGWRSFWVGTGGPQGEFLALERADAPEPPGATPLPEPRRDGAGHHLVAFRIPVAARRAWEDHLDAAGFPVTHRTAFTLYVDDPEGNRLALSHHPDPAEDRDHSSGGGGSAPPGTVDSWPR
jgi:catechol 2,3-dioxygenase-like lactoylglutathione lyase family enzyme